MPIFPATPKTTPFTRTLLLKSNATEFREFIDFIEENEDWADLSAPTLTDDWGDLSAATNAIDWEDTNPILTSL